MGMVMRLNPNFVSMVETNGVDGEAAPDLVSMGEKAGVGRKPLLL